MSSRTSGSSSKRECPVLSDQEVHAVYNELLKLKTKETEGTGETLNTRNQMPVGLRNKPMQGQLAPLSTDRKSSAIPKGNSAETWTYPSPQMFFNGQPLTHGHCLMTLL